MKKQFVIVCFMALIAGVFTGCQTAEKVVDGIAAKDISGSGTIAISRVGLDTTTQTPEIFNLMVVGDYNSNGGDGEQLRVEYNEDSSIFNTQAVSKSYKMVFFSSDTERVDGFIDKATTSISNISSQSDSSESPNK